MMCKHFNTTLGCSYGDKCQFAHSTLELRMGNQNIMNPAGISSQVMKNPLNYKIVKCKNYERDGTCKFGAMCSFAHGIYNI